MKLSSKLYLGFALVLVITAALGCFAYSRISNIDKTAKIIVAENLTGVYMMGDINANVRRTLQLAALHILADGPEKKAEQEKKLEETKALVTKVLDEYEATITR